MKRNKLALLGLFCALSLTSFSLTSCDDNNNGITETNTTFEFTNPGNITIEGFIRENNTSKLIEDISTYSYKEGDVVFFRIIAAEGYLVNSVKFNGEFVRSDNGSYQVTFVSGTNSLVVDVIKIETDVNNFTFEYNEQTKEATLVSYNEVNVPTPLVVPDTITNNENPAIEPLPGYKKVNPMVYCGLYPMDGSDYENLKVALEKLQLNDAALEFEPETSNALGSGFRCGFLGLLHLEIIEERLDREFDLSLITTAPSVIYKVYKTDGEVISIYNPSDLPPQTQISKIEEPFVDASIMVPKDFVGNVMTLCQDRRGIYVDMQYLDENRVTLKYELPLNEIIYDFFDSLKSRTKGYASLDYYLKDYKESDLVKLDIYVNNEKVDALSFIVHKSNAYNKGRNLVERLKEEIPRQLFAIPIQAAIGGQIIARETISALRKDVLAKCYGGDITRKKKLLEKQKRGKKRMREFGNVEIPQEAFLNVLKGSSKNGE